jgi:ArsR family transcriptional regulator
MRRYADVGRTTMEDEANVFKILGEPTRLRLAILLALKGETCVCMLAQALDEPDFKVSRHLAGLRATGLVKAKREGIWIYYRLSDTGTPSWKRLRNCLKDCFGDHPVTVGDLARLARAACGPGTANRKAPQEKRRPA